MTRKQESQEYQSYKRYKKNKDVTEEDYNNRANACKNFLF